MDNWFATVSVLSLSALLLPSVGNAEAGVGVGAQPVTVQEVIVTAQKRQERINDVPLSITALSAAELKSRNVLTTTDLVRVVPGFNYQPSLGGAPIYYIRGVGFADLAPGAAPTVTVYADEVPLPFSDMSRGAALDVTQVEVLKGPQGTLFGGNSTGGAVNFIAAKPTNVLEGGGSVGFGRFSAANLETYLSGPLNDKISLRIAGEYRTQGDWQYSATRPGDTRGQKDFLNGRISAAAQPTDKLKLLLTVSGWRDRSDRQTPQLVMVSPSAPYPPVINALEAVAYVPTNARITDWFPGSEKRRDDSFYQISLRGDLDLTEHLKLTSISSYSNLSLHVPASIEGVNFPSATVDDAAGRVVTQEVRLADDTSALHWMIGGNYQHVNAPETTTATPSVATNAFGLYEYYRMINNQEYTDYAVFASADRQLTDTLTARASIRFSQENRKHQGCLADYGDGQLAFAFGQLIIPVIGGQPTNIPPGACVTADDATRRPVLSPAPSSLNQNNVSWRVGLDWKARPDTLVYATIAKGYKAGGYTLTPAVLVSQMKPVTQESVVDYEVGLKTDLFDRRVHVDVAGFYYDYSNKQLQGYVTILPFGPLPTLVNIPSSRIVGGEISLTAHPTRGLRLQLAGTIVDSKVLKDPSSPEDPFGHPTSFVGEPFPNTPKYQATADVEQSFPVSDKVEAYVGGSLQYHSSASGTFGSESSPLAHSLATLNSYVLLDLRAGVRISHPDVRIEVWGANVTNKYYWNAAYSYEDAFVRFAGEPATWGVRLSYSY